MTQEDLNKLKVEITKDALKTYIHNVIVTQERVMYLNNLYADASKKKEKERTEEDKKIIREHEANLAAFMGGISDSDSRIQNFITLINAYTNNEPIKL